MSADAAHALDLKDAPRRHTVPLVKRLALDLEALGQLADPPYRSRSPSNDFKHSHSV